MSVQRNRYGQVEFVCDECGDVCETGEEDFQDAVDAIKEGGWRIQAPIPATGNQWSHTCVDCRRS